MVGIMRDSLQCGKGKTSWLSMVSTKQRTRNLHIVQNVVQRGAQAPLSHELLKSSLVMYLSGIFSAPCYLEEEWWINSLHQCLGINLEDAKLSLFLPSWRRNTNWVIVKNLGSDPTSITSQVTLADHSTPVLLSGIVCPQHVSNPHS